MERDYIEQTGQLTRVGVIAARHTTDAAIGAFAAREVGYPDAAYHDLMRTEYGAVVTFETAYLTE